MLLARPQYFQLEPQQQKPIRHQRNFHRPPRKKNKIKKNSKRLIKSLHEWQCRRKRLANKRPQHWSSDIKRVRPREREEAKIFSYGCWSTDAIVSQMCEISVMSLTKQNKNKLNNSNYKTWTDFCIIPWINSCKKKKKTKKINHSVKRIRK